MQRTSASGSVPEGEGAQPLLMTTLLRFESAHQRGSVSEMRACFHDEALIESVASGGRPLGPDETAAALRAAIEDSLYVISDWNYEEIRPGVVLSWTAARHRSASGGIAHETVYRATIGRDGLMWRVKLFDKRGDALAYIEEQ
jgi:hypothetical protein